MDEEKPRNLIALRYACDHLDLEIEPGQPVYSDGSPVGIRRLGENPLPDFPNRCELVLWIGVERRDIHKIVERAACGIECSLQVVEGQLDLAFEIRFRCSVAAAADLSLNEKKIA